MGYLQLVGEEYLTLTLDT
ncbi:Protein of unknown function [Bacillus mycoides]|uniref:Uncharacterized protein n=1 Tax=Bacillus mycoides TaxID=1405 RepID=A0A1C4DWY4_BACMY|nr:Protein of unknown function [Bacillus mycoides]SCC35853.1 Protein of unknown function [Bacillus mycoides]SCM95370.1 Protein of unknown function [Bacillus mycoides]